MEFFLYFVVALWFVFLTFPRQILENRIFVIAIIALNIFLQVADSVLTMLRVFSNGIFVEANPLFVIVFQQYGLWGFAAIKLTACILLAVLLFNATIIVRNRLAAAAFTALAGVYSIACSLHIFFFADDLFTSLP